MFTKTKQGLDSFRKKLRHYKEWLQQELKAKTKRRGLNATERYHKERERLEQIHLEAENRKQYLEGMMDALGLTKGEKVEELKTAGFNERWMFLKRP